MEECTCPECEELRDQLMTSEAGRRIEARENDRLSFELQEMALRYSEMRAELEQYRAGRVAA